MDRLLKRKQRFGVITNTTATEGGVKRLSTEGSTDDAEVRMIAQAHLYRLQGLDSSHNVLTTISV